MSEYQFPCGCRWPIIREAASSDTLPLLSFDPDPRNRKIPYTCTATWEAVARGDTKGVFQLEKDLGKTWARTMRPDRLEHMSALGALLRPGCLRAELENGVSMTSMYCKRKNGEREIQAYHPLLDPILEKTYNVLVYQEQSMRIAREIAGFDLKNVDRLRKAIGKKDQKEMAAVGQLFLAGAKEKGAVPYEIAEIIWGWIEKSGRYQFNRAHSWSYGVLGYITAYCKIHFPVQYFCSWIGFAHQKSDAAEEVRELIYAAKLYDVPINLPDIRVREPHASTDFRSITFGLADIKGVGDSFIKRFTTIVPETESQLGKPLSAWNWYEFLTRLSQHISSQNMVALVRAGALRHFGLTRNRVLHEIKLWRELTDTEQDWVNSRSFTDLTSALKALAQPKKGVVKRVPKQGMEAEALRLDTECLNIPDDEGYEEQFKKNRRAYNRATVQVEEPLTAPPGGCATDARRKAVLSFVSLLEKPPTSMEDYPNEIAAAEEELFGVPISCSRVDVIDQSEVNTTCKDFVQGSNGHNGYIVMAVEIQQVREKKCKSGKNEGRTMAYLSIADGTSALSDVVCFPEDYFQHGYLLSEGNCVILQGERDRKRGSLIIKRVSQA